MTTLKPYYRTINHFLRTKGFDTVDKAFDFFEHTEIEYIKQNKHLIKNEEYRNKILNIYFTHCLLFITDIEKALKIDKFHNTKLKVSIGDVLVCADVKLNFSEKPDNQFSVEVSWSSMGGDDIKDRFDDEVMGYFCSQIKELEIKSAFLSKEKFKKEIEISVLKWLKRKVNFEQEIFDKLPELIVGYYEQ